MIISTRIPADRHSATAAGTLDRRGSAKPIRPMYSKSIPRGESGSAATCVGVELRRSGDREHPDSTAGQFIHLSTHGSQLIDREVAEFADRFQSALRVGASAALRLIVDDIGYRE